MVNVVKSVVCCLVSVPALATDAVKPADAPRTSEVPSSSRTQLQMLLSQSRLDGRLWLDCRLALARTLLSTAGRLCGSDG